MNSALRVDRALWVMGVLVLVSATSAAAQTGAATPDQSSPAPLNVSPGQRVAVTTSDGRVYWGAVRELSNSGLALVTKAGEQTLSRNQIRLIRHQDSLVNGMVIGGLIGTGAIFPLASLYLGGDETPEPGTAVGLLAVGAAAGVATGVLVDALRSRVLYRAGAPVRTTIAATIAPRGGGVRLTVRW
jgi:hypothetical protein